MANQTEDKPIVFPDSPEAAYWGTAEGWISRRGLFFGRGEAAKELARSDGCTYYRCKDCGGLSEKYWTRCKKCRERDEQRRFAALPKEHWRGDTPVEIFGDDRFFHDWDAVLDHCEEHEVHPRLLMLQHTKPDTPPQVELEDVFSDYLPQDAPTDGGYVPNEVRDALEHLNQVLKQHAPYAYVPSASAVIVPDSVAHEYDKAQELR